MEVEPEHEWTFLLIGTITGRLPGFLPRTLFFKRNAAWKVHLWTVAHALPRKPRIPNCSQFSCNTQKFEYLYIVKQQKFTP